MAAPRFGRVQKATALVPLALLSAAWTASIASTGGIAAATVSADPTGATLPDGTTVPEQAIEDAASLTTPGILAPGVTAGRVGAMQVARTASTNGIPAAALAAYQRAETVINAADKGCNMQWELLAAIGRVESDHGRFGGNVLDDQGVATPGIYGIALDGKNDTTAISDTDAGQYDDDPVWDRAVGPMQFIPSTWSVVGVDADGDGARNPQDVDDAALASAVYLCSGDDDLSTVSGQRTAVFRYNHSDAYVDLVLSVMRSYMMGDFSAVPNGTTSAAFFVPDPTPPTATAQPHGQQQPERQPERGGQTTAGGSAPAVADESDEQAQLETPTDDQPQEPAPQEPSPPSTPVRDPGKAVEETVKGAGETVKDVTDGVEETVKDLGEDPVKEVEETLTHAEATAQCLASGISKLDVLALGRCVTDLLNS